MTLLNSSNSLSSHDLAARTKPFAAVTPISGAPLTTISFIAKQVSSTVLAVKTSKEKGSFR